MQRTRVWSTVRKPRCCGVFLEDKPEILSAVWGAERAHLRPGQGRRPSCEDSTRRLRVCRRCASLRGACYGPTADSAAAAVSPSVRHSPEGLRDFPLRQPLAGQEGALLVLAAGPHFGVLQEGDCVLDLVLPVANTEAAGQVAVEMTTQCAGERTAGRSWRAFGGTAVV